MSQNVNVRTNTGPVARQAQALNQQASLTNTLLNRLRNPRGATSAGGGRGGFTGGLSDFLTRDEFIGRSGTIFRGLQGGHLLGAALAFISIDELSTRLLRIFQGKADFKDMVSETLEFLTPTLLRSTIPAFFMEYERRRQNRMKEEVKEAIRQAKFEHRIKRDPELQREVKEWRQIRFANSEEYRRQMAGIQRLRGF